MADALEALTADQVREVAALIVTAADWPFFPEGTGADVVAAAENAQGAARRRLFTDFGGEHRAAYNIVRFIAAGGEITHV